MYSEQINNAAPQAAAVGPVPHCAVVRAFENADVSSYKETTRIAGVNGDIKGWQTPGKAPACASIGALEQTTTSRRIDGRRVESVNRERLDISRGQSVFKFRPRRATIGALEHALVCSCIHRVRVAGINRDRLEIIIFEKALSHLGPGCASVGSLKNTGGS